MLKTKVGYSENTDSFASGVETAQMANVIENPQVGLLFTSCVQDQAKIMEGVKSVLGDVPVVGCTSSAAICTQDGYLNKETGYSGMMLFGGDLEVVTAGSAQTSETPREVGRRVAKEAISKVKGNDVEPDFFFMTASPANEEEYLEGEYLAAPLAVDGKCPPERPLLYSKRCFSCQAVDDLSISEEECQTTKDGPELRQ